MDNAEVMHKLGQIDGKLDRLINSIELVQSDLKTLAEKQQNDKNWLHKQIVKNKEKVVELKTNQSDFKLWLKLWGSAFIGIMLLILRKIFF